ncbi:MAG: hypothetical protein GY719_24910 [bacterium]|nr:hypothetical protein [bacterium]
MIIKNLETLRRCSSRTAYEYEQADVELMFKELRARVDSCERSFKDLPEVSFGTAPQSQE